MMASHYGYVAIVKLLLRAGVDLNAVAAVSCDMVTFLCAYVHLQLRCKRSIIWLPFAYQSTSIMSENGAANDS